MKQLLKPLLILTAFLAVFYALSPWWLPAILATQLPSGWQLESLKMSWPGFTGVNLKHAEARGNLPGLNLTIEAENSRLSYKGLATTVESLMLHVYLPSSQDKPPVPLSIDDLSLPMFQLSANLPSVTVDKAQLALHLASNNPEDINDQPIVIALQGFKLDPAGQGHYQLDTTASIVGQQAANGHFNLAVSPDSLSALVRFPADDALPAWLDVTFSQVNVPDLTESELKLQFDANAAGDERLDALLRKSTLGRLTHVGGQLQAQVVFNGDQIRYFSEMFIRADRFQVDFDGVTGVIDSDIQAVREAQTVLLKFSDSGDLNVGNSYSDNSGAGDSANNNSGSGNSGARDSANSVSGGDDSDVGESGAGRLSLLDKSGQIETALANAIPELKRSRKGNMVSAATAKLKISPTSQLVLNLPESTLTKPSLSFSGGLALDYSTASSSIQLKLDELNVAIADLGQAGHLNLASELSLSWQEQGPFSYTNDTLSVAANSLALQASGSLAWAPEQISLKPTGKIDVNLPGLKAKIQTGEVSAPGWIEFAADNFQVTQAQLGFDLIGPTQNNSTHTGNSSLDNSSLANSDLDNRDSGGGNSSRDSSTSYLFKGPLLSVNPKITVISSVDAPATIITASEVSVDGSFESHANELRSSGTGYLNKAQIMPLAANASRLDLNWTDLNLTSLTGRLDAKTEGFNIEIEENTWTGFDLDAKLELLKDDNIRGSGNLGFNGNTELPIEFSGNTESGWWDITLPTSTVPLSRLRSILRSAHIELPAELKLTNGTIGVGGLIQIHDIMSAQLDLSGADIAADLAESNAQQASFQFNAGYKSDIFASGPLAVQHLGLAGGIDITDIKIDLQLENAQTFELNNMSANLFDGQLEIDRLSYANGEIEDTAINLTHINLQKLFLFLDVDGLNGTGFIDFHLPAGSHGSAVHITDGTFASTGPGRLAYSKGDLASTNIGLQALDNFHYKDLSGNIAYDSTGPYKITIHLEGSNPDLYNGYPLVFNLTINGSLPALFEAMFMTGSFDESILEQIKMQ